MATKASPEKYLAECELSDLFHGVTSEEGLPLLADVVGEEALGFGFSLSYSETLAYLTEKYAAFKAQ